MSRGFVAAAIALAVAAAGACGKKGGGEAQKPLVERELAPATHKVNAVDITISVPKGVAGGVKDAATLQWTAAGDPALDVRVDASKTPVAMQNALNDAASASLNVSRSDELPDGWLVTAGAADGTTTRVQRQVKVSDTRAVVCTASVTWGKAAKKVDWAESICKSLAAKPQ